MKLAVSRIIHSSSPFPPPPSSSSSLASPPLAPLPLRLAPLLALERLLLPNPLTPPPPEAAPSCCCAARPSSPRLAFVLEPGQAPAPAPATVLARRPPAPPERPAAAAARASAAASATAARTWRCALSWQEMERQDGLAVLHNIRSIGFKQVQEFRARARNKLHGRGNPCQVPSRFYQVRV